VRRILPDKAARDLKKKKRKADELVARSHGFAGGKETPSNKVDTHVSSRRIGLIKHCDGLSSPRKKDDIES
jgi:hypothetical protein